MIGEQFHPTSFFDPGIMDKVPGCGPGFCVVGSRVFREGGIADSAVGTPGERGAGARILGVVRMGTIGSLRLASRPTSATLPLGPTIMSSEDAPSAALAGSRLFVVSRNSHIVPKERRIERLPSGYSVQEPCDASEGCYWVVVTALDVA